MVHEVLVICSSMFASASQFCISVALLHDQSNQSPFLVWCHSNTISMYHLFNTNPQFLNPKKEWNSCPESTKNCEYVQANEILNRFVYCFCLFYLLYEVKSKVKLKTHQRVWNDSLKNPVCLLSPISSLRLHFDVMAKHRLSWMSESKTV